MTEGPPRTEPARAVSDVLLPGVAETAPGTIPKPLIRQVLLVGATVVAVLFLVSQDPQISPNLYFLTGVALLLVTTGLAALVGRRPAVRAATALLVLDLAAIGLMRLVEGGSAIGLLCVLPAMWLAAEQRMRAVPITFVATGVLVSAPSLLQDGTSAAQLARAVLLPVLGALCALTVAGIAQMWLQQTRQLQQQTRELQEQGRRLQHALAEATSHRALNDAIVSTADVGLVTLDRTGTFTSVNPRMRQLLLLSHPRGHPGRAGEPGAVFAADGVTPLPHEELPTARAAVGEQLSDVVVWMGEDPETRKALAVSAGPIRDADGRVDGAVLAYKDITDLMSALKVKDDFVASVSHELRTPLTSIMGYVDLVLDTDDALDPMARRHLEIVQRNAVRLLRLVGDLLFTAQLEEGRIALEVGPADLVTLVEHAVADLRPRAEQAGVRLRCRLPDELPVRVDATRIRQMVDNLVGNAVKYTMPGGTVDVALRREGDDAVLTVSDTGIGIAAKDQRQLFTRFFRTEDVESRAIQGIGLGLAITKSIIDAHGGAIEVSSDLGQGSTFTVRLPAPDDVPPGGQAVVSAMHAVATLSKPTRS